MNLTVMLKELDQPKSDVQFKDLEKEQNDLLLPCQFDFIIPTLADIMVHKKGNQSI